MWAVLLFKPSPRHNASACFTPPYLQIVLLVMRPPAVVADFIKTLAVPSSAMPAPLSASAASSAAAHAGVAAVHHESPTSVDVRALRAAQVRASGAWLALLALF
jgi:hypothetical protein